MYAPIMPLLVAAFANHIDTCIAYIVVIVFVIFVLILDDITIAWNYDCLVTLARRWC